MVSGRHKAYEHADSPGDSLANDTSASAFSLELTVIEDAKVNRRHITVEGQRFSRVAIDKLVGVASHNTNKEFPSLRGYNGEEAVIVEAHGELYIALMKLQSSGGCMHFIVYDFADGKVKRAKTRLEKRSIEQGGIEQGGPDYECENLLEKLEREYKAR